MTMPLDMNTLLDISGLPGAAGEEIVPHEKLELIEVVSNPNDRTHDLEDDYTLVRRNMHFQSQMLVNAAEIFLESAKNADSPRHMEVFATLMGQMTTTNKELLRMHKDMKDITTTTTTTGASAAPQGNVNVANANIFVGSASDLLDEIGDAFETKQKQQEALEGQAEEV